MRDAWIDASQWEVHLAIDGITFWIFQAEDKEDAEHLKAIWLDGSMRMPEGRTSKIVE